MNREDCIVEKTKVERIIDKSCKTILSGLFLKNFSGCSKKHLKRKKHNQKKGTIKVNLAIALQNGSPNIAHSKTSIEDLFVFEYEYGLTPHALLKNSKLRIN
jgi:phage terminase small subunit